MKKRFKLVRYPLSTIYKIAKLYIEKYEGFSYDVKKNGESLLVNSLKDFEFKTVFDVGANIGSGSTPFLWKVLCRNFL